MKKLFFQLFYFVFKPIIPLFMFTYFVRAISYYFLIIIGLSLLIFGWIENSRFLIILAGITGVFTIALFFFDLFINKEEILMKKRKGVINNEISDKNISNIKNPQEADDDEDDNDDNSDDKNERPLIVWFIEQISGFWLWTLFYGIYAYFAHKDYVPAIIALAMFILNKILSIKKS